MSFSYGAIRSTRSLVISSRWVIFTLQGIDLIILGGKPGLELGSELAKLSGELFLKLTLAHLILSPYA